MPSRKKRVWRRRRRTTELWAMILMFACVALMLVYLLIQADPIGRSPEATRTGTLTELDFGAARSGTGDPLVVRREAPGAAAPADVSPASAAENDPEPETVPQKENRLIPDPPEGEYYLPVFSRAERSADDPLMIAITVEDCSDAEKMKTLVTAAQKYQAALTLFPYGESEMAEGMARYFRSWVRDLGYELENHCYSHKPEYRMLSDEAVLQIWKQSVATSYVVGKDYTQHFYRPYAKGADTDMRTHYLIGQLGFLGIGSYTYSYKDVRDIGELQATLANGNIYSFDLSDKSMEMFEAFLEKANQKGYSMVTMNRLFSLPENEISDTLTIDRQEMPHIPDCGTLLYDLHLNDRTYSVLLMQQQLINLGYFENKIVEYKGYNNTVTRELVEPTADGVYGPDTSVAVSTFQGKVGLPATGNADVATQERIYAWDAPPAG